MKKNKMGVVWPGSRARRRLTTELNKSMVRVKPIIIGTVKGVSLSRNRIFAKYALVPIGYVVSLACLYGVNKLLRMSPVNIPASVACMLVLFIGLLALEAVLGSKKTTRLVRIIDVPLGFGLRWINIMFTPSFTLLPLAPSVSVGETFKIAAVFIIGYFVMLAGSVYFVWGVQKLSNISRRPFDNPGRHPGPSLGARTTAIELESSAESDGVSDDDAHSNQSAASTPNTAGSLSPKRNPQQSPKQPPALLSPQQSHGSSVGMASPVPAAVISRPNNPGMTIPDRCLNGNFPAYFTQQQQSLLGHDDFDESDRVAQFVSKNLDWFIYSLLAFIGIIVYLTTGYAVFLHMAIIVLCYFATQFVPTQYRQFLHPIPICGGASIFFIYFFGLWKKETLHSNLENFKTGRNYLTLFDHEYSNVLPGAGDVISSMLDISIMALAMPMYNYRTDLRRHLLQLVVPTVVFGVGSYLVYPVVAYQIGIESTRSLAFMARSVTLALAIPIVHSVGGSTTMISVLAILSGVFGVLFGRAFLGPRWLRVREDDYVSRGISLGICSSAVASAHLLTIDPRAAALSSLSFFLYGVVMVILSSIPPLVTLIRAWVDLGPIST